LKKSYFIIILIIALSLIILPLPILYQTDDAKSAVLSENPKDNITIIMNDGAEKTISKYDFLFGILCNLNPNYNIETYKAQTVASYTLLEYAKLNGKDKIPQNSVYYQNYLTKSRQKEMLGEDYKKAEKKIKSALDSVYGKQILYKDKPILALYCEVSAGKTESYKVIFKKDLDYLKSVQSVSDLLSPNYQSTVILAPKEVKSALKDYNIKWQKDKSEWFKIPKTSDSGYIASQKVGDKSFSGKTLYKKLNLKSPYFDVEYKDGKFNFICRGLGYGIGLSLYGANYMAQNGCDYKEILNWYYKDCTIKG
jgi:stage II sporulation protein D